MAKSRSKSTTTALYNLAQRKKTQRQTPNTSTRGAAKGMNFYLGEMKKNAAKQIIAKKEKETGKIEPTARQKAAYIPSSKEATKSSRPKKRK